MRNIILAFLLSFLSSFSLAQNKKIEDFINQAYKSVVPSHFEYYNLIDSSFSTTFSNSLDRAQLNDLLKSNPDFPISIFEQHRRDDSIVNWSNYHLEKAIHYSMELVPKFESSVEFSVLVPYTISKKRLDSLEKHKLYNQVIVRVKSSWSRQRKNKEVEKAWLKRATNTRAENKNYYRFSTPIFSEDNRYAVLKINQSAAGATYIFKNIDNQWTEILAFDYWQN